MKAKCKKCGDTVEVTKLREYKTCKCGAIGLDYGDEYYYRVCGNPENFDGEIEGAPKIEERVKPSELCNVDESINQTREYLQCATKVKEFWMNVNVDLCEDGTLYIDDAESDEQLAVFRIKENNG